MTKPPIKDPPIGEPLFEVVLFEPEIPNNTGNIGRSCLAMASSLHLIEPLGFDISEKAVRRAGLDYWPRLLLQTHASWEAYLRATGERTRWYFSTRTPAQHAATPPWAAPLSRGDHLIFGPESRGLPGALLEGVGPSVLTFPMNPGERSLNLSTAVCSALTEAVRQLAAKQVITLDSDARIQIKTE